MNAIKKMGFSRGGNSVVRGLALLGIVLAAILIAHPRSLTASAKASAAPKTTNDGVYTADQAKQGNVVYGTDCSNCHMDDLSGSGQAPPLAGEIFMANWEGRTVGDLFDTTRDTMPMNQPDSLTAKQYVDLVAYLLQANGFPAGKDELTGDSQALKGIIIEKKSNTK
jgi:mono/diheme cytochrome c family protein